MYDAAKTAEIAAASDKIWASPPPGIKPLASYVCLGMPFPGIPPNSLVTVGIGEAESDEALAAVTYPLMLAGATIHRVPILEVPIGGGVEAEKKYRG